MPSVTAFQWIVQYDNKGKLIVNKWIPLGGASGVPVDSVTIDPKATYPIAIVMKKNAAISKTTPVMVIR